MEQIQQGQVPSIIQNLPQEALAQITDVVSIALLVPSQVINFATAAETDAASVIDEIEDGSITSAIDALPSDVYSEVTMGWSDLTAGLTDAWDDATGGIKCLFGGCPSSTASPSGSCSAPAAAAATTTSYNAGGSAATSYMAGGGAAATTYQPTAAATSAYNTDNLPSNPNTYSRVAGTAAASGPILTGAANPGLSFSGLGLPFVGPSSSPGSGSPGPAVSASSHMAVIGQDLLLLSVIAVVAFRISSIVVLL